MNEKSHIYEEKKTNLQEKSHELTRKKPDKFTKKKMCHNEKKTQIYIFLYNFYRTFPHYPHLLKVKTLFH